MRDARTAAMHNAIRRWLLCLVSGTLRWSGTCFTHKNRVHMAKSASLVRSHSLIASLSVPARYLTLCSVTVSMYPTSGLAASGCGRQRTRTIHSSAALRTVHREGDEFVMCSAAKPFTTCATPHGWKNGRQVSFWTVRATRMARLRRRKARGRRAVRRLTGLQSHLRERRSFANHLLRAT